MAPPPAGVQRARTRRGISSRASRVLLLSADLENAALFLALPRSGDGAVGERKILNLTVDDVGDGGPRFVLGVRLEVHQPPGGIERRGLDWNVVRARVDHYRDVL